MSRIVDKTVNQYIRYIKKTKRQNVPAEISHIMKDFLQREQHTFNIDDHMMWLNIQNMFENMKNGVDFEEIDQDAKTIYSERKIAISDKFKNIELDDISIYYYIKTIKCELQHMFDYLEDKDKNVIKCGVCEIVNGSITDKSKNLNDFLNEFKALIISEEMTQSDTCDMGVNDSFELTKKVASMLVSSLGITKVELVQMSMTGYKQFEKKAQELNKEFGKLVTGDNQDILKTLKEGIELIKTSQDDSKINEEKAKFVEALEKAYMICMQIFATRIAEYFEDKKELKKEELNEFFEKIQVDRCKIRDIYNKTVKEYTKLTYINSNHLKSKEIKRAEKYLNVMLEKIFNLKSDNRVIRKYVIENENIKYKDVIIKYIMSKEEDERKNKNDLERIVGIQTSNFVKYNISSNYEQTNENDMLLDRRLKYRVIKAIKTRVMIDKIKIMFKIKENVLLLKENNTPVMQNIDNMDIRVE